MFCILLDDIIESRFKNLVNQLRTSAVSLFTRLGLLWQWYLNANKWTDDSENSSDYTYQISLPEFQVADVLETTMSTRNIMGYGNSKVQWISSDVAFLNDFKRLFVRSKIVITKLLYELSTDEDFFFPLLKRIVMQKTKEKLRVFLNSLICLMWQCWSELLYIWFRWSWKNGWYLCF